MENANEKINIKEYIPTEDVLSLNKTDNLVTNYELTGWTNDARFTTIDIPLIRKMTIPISEQQKAIEEFKSNILDENGKLNELVVNVEMFKILLKYFTNFNELVETDNLTLDDYSNLQKMNESNLDEIYEFSYEKNHSINFSFKLILKREVDYLRERQVRSNPISIFIDELLDSLGNLKNKDEIFNLIGDVLSSTANTNK